MTEQTTEQETKTFTQEEVGRLIADARNEAKRQAENERLRLEQERAAERTARDEQIAKLRQEQEQMQSTFHEFMARNAERFDERTDEEKLRDEVQRLNARLDKQAEENRKMLEQTQQSQTQLTRDQQLTTLYAHSVASFEKPDYGDALKFLQDTRRKELALVGIDDPLQVDVALKNDQQVLTEAAMARGDSPAAKIYEAAMLRGYKPKESDEPKPENGAEEIALRQKGENAQDLIEGGGALKGGLKGLSKMTKEERDALLDPKKNKNYKENYAAIMAQFAQR